MTVIDAFSAIALLRDGPAAYLVDRFVRGDPPPALTSLGLAEVVDHLVSVVGVEDDEAVLDVAQLGLAIPAAVDEALATQAALLRARRYHGRTMAVSMADCVAAEAPDAPARPWPLPTLTCSTSASPSRSS